MLVECISSSDDSLSFPIEFLYDNERQKEMVVWGLTIRVGIVGVVFLVSVIVVKSRTRLLQFEYYCASRVEYIHDNYYIVRDDVKAGTQVEQFICRYGRVIFL
ncbi:MAG: hypothetical protein ACK4NF_05505 [Planctomycetota bacterium]